MLSMCADAGAQCGHAAVGVLQKYQNKAAHEMAFRQWEYMGQAKIALRVQDEDEMVGAQLWVSG